MHVPFMDLKRLVWEVAEDVTDDWGACLAAAEFVGGPRVDRLEEQVAAALGVRHVAACANGTDALVLALRAAGVGAGDRVAIPNLTFWATYEAVVAVGATPVLVDVDPDDLQMSWAALSAAADIPDGNLTACIFVHLFGWTSAHIFEIRRLCEHRGIILIEDAAQAFGVERDGRGVLAPARFATLSFYPAKVIGGAGDGGAVVCRDAADDARIRSLRNHGRAAAYEHTEPGYNSRMSAPNAAYLSRVVARSDDIIAARRAALAHYRERLDGIDGFKVWGPPAGVTGNGYLAVVTHSSHDGTALASALGRADIGWARTYPITVADQPGARGAEAVGSLAVSREFARRVVNPPLFYGIRPDEIDAACDALLAAAHTSTTTAGR